VRVGGRESAKGDGTARGGRARTAGLARTPGREELAHRAWVRERGDQAHPPPAAGAGQDVEPRTRAA
jgi:hypothetical protein